MAGPGVHVTLDALALGERPGGVGRYIMTLLSGLKSTPGAPRISVAVRHGIAPLLPHGSAFGPGPVSSRPPLRLAWEQVVLPLRARLLRSDLIHGLMGIVPLTGSVPSVVTIHDVTFLTHPELHQAPKVAYFRALLPLVARRARLILTDSEASRGEIVRALRVPDERVHVVPLAVEPSFVPATSAAVHAVRLRFGLRGPFVLYAGVLEPRKNLPRLLAAMQLLRRKGLPHELVLAGKRGWGVPELERALAEAGPAARCLGFVSDAELQALYGACEAFAYVPLVEGFGLPLAEALACGVPVLTSRVSSLAEVAGDAALLVDPLDTQAIADGLQRILESASLRGELARRGLFRAARWTPERLARETLAAYLQALGG